MILDRKVVDLGLKRKIRPGRLLLFIGLCIILSASAYFVSQIALRTETGKRMMARVGREDLGIKRGLDIAGGLYVLLEAVETGDEELDADAIERAAAVIRMRVDELGVAEPVIVPQGEKRIRIELPDIKNPEQARDIIGRTARLSFVGPDGKEVLTGSNLRRAQAMRDPSEAAPFVSLEFDKEGSRLFAEATGQFLGKQIFIVLDGEIISDPVVKSVITEGQARITNPKYTFEEAANLALLLRSGSLPLEFKELETRLIGPTLGQRTEQISLAAAGVGLAAVALYMLLFYRFSGIIAGVGLAFYLTLALGVLTFLPGYTLTLPGMAGLVLSIGMAVDANVIIFEQIKEELRLGRSIRTALENGFKNALRTILDSNVTTIIATVVLFVLASGPVKGFAVTLFIGILASMFTAVFLARMLLRLAFKAGIIRSSSYLGVKS